MLIPRLILLPLEVATHFNTIVEMIAEWVVICITSIGVLQLIRKTDADAPFRHIVCVWFLCNLLIFTPGQWENLLWGAGLINVLPMAFTVWMMVILVSRMTTIARLTAAIAFAAAATYSLGNGILAWPIGILLLLKPGDERRIRNLALWLMAALIFFALYFVHYKRPDHSGTEPYATNLSEALNYFIHFLGAPFAYSTPFRADHAAAVMGSLMLILLCINGLFVLRAWRKNRRDPRVVQGLCWFGVAFFAVASAALAAYTRAGLGVAQAIQSTRYVSFAIYLPVALIVLMSAAFRDESRHPYSAPPSRRVAPIPAAAAAVLILLQFLGYPQAVNSCRVECDVRHQTKAAMLLINIVPDNPAVQLVFSDADILRNEANALSALGALRPPVVSSPNAALIRDASASSSQVLGLLETGTKRPSGEFAVIGWAASNHPRPPDAILLTCDDAENDPIIFKVAQVGIPRDDIAQQLAMEGVQPVGWFAVFPPSTLPVDLPKVNIRAWWFNADSGKATPLLGSVTFQR